MSGRVERAARENDVIITLSGRHLEITAAIRTHAEEKANKLTKFYDLIQEIEVVLEGSAGTEKRRKVEFVVKAEHKNTFVASAEGDDLYGCIDQVCHKLERQLTDHKERFRNRKHIVQG
jgi:putative sigma-54 modulation protein